MKRAVDDDIMSRARALYETTDMSLADISRESVRLFGKHIPIGTLRAKQHEEGWSKEVREVSYDDFAAISRLENIIYHELQREDLTTNDILNLARAVERLLAIKGGLLSRNIGLSHSGQYIGRTTAVNDN